jgi:hypothetical protein
MKFLIDRALSWPNFETFESDAGTAIGAKDALRTIYRPGPFQRAQICEDRSLGTGVLSGLRNCLKVKKIISKLKPIKDLEGLMIVIMIIIIKKIKFKNKVSFGLFWWGGKEHSKPVPSFNAF